MIEFAQAIHALCDSGVDFVVIGGWSAILHGVNYSTNDLDICYSRDRANVKRLVACLAPLNPRPRDFPSELPFVWDEATVTNMTVLTLTTKVGMIDLLADVSGVGDYREALAHSIVVDAFGRSVRTLDLPAIISAKRAARRAKDIGVLNALEALLDSSENE